MADGAVCRRFDHSACCGCPRELPAVRHAHADARAVPRASADALKGGQRTVNARPSALARAHAVDTRAVAVAVSGAAPRRALAARPRKARRAHAGLVDAGSVP
jgi:hypothetical protein